MRRRGGQWVRLVVALRAPVSTQGTQRCEASMRKWAGGSVVTAEEGAGEWSVTGCQRGGVWIVCLCACKWDHVALNVNILHAIKLSHCDSSQSSVAVFIYSTLIKLFLHSSTHPLQMNIKFISKLFSHSFLPSSSLFLVCVVLSGVAAIFVNKTEESGFLKENLSSWTTSLTSILLSFHFALSKSFCRCVHLIESLKKDN